VGGYGVLQEHLEGHIELPSSTSLLVLRTTAEKSSR